MKTSVEKERNMNNNEENREEVDKKQWSIKRKMKEKAKRFLKQEYKNI